MRLLAFILRFLPLGLAAALGRGLGRAVYRLDARHRRQAARQIIDAYGGEVPEEKALEIVRNMYRHFGAMAAEIVRIPSMSRDNLDRRIDWNGHDGEIREIMASGKGCVMVTGHIGNWEVCGAAFALRGYSVGALARPLDNSLIDRFLNGIREGSGQRIWIKWGALRRVVRVLREGKGFGILVDQDADSLGLFVPFFGRAASTIPTPADLAMIYGTPILVAALHRSGKPMRFILKTRPLIWPRPGADREEERLRLLARVNEALESIIREAPEQWLWIHRRWRTRPPDESRPAGSPA